MGHSILYLFTFNDFGPVTVMPCGGLLFCRILFCDIKKGWWNVHLYRECIEYLLLIYPFLTEYIYIYMSSIYVHAVWEDSLYIVLLCLEVLNG